MADDDDVLDSKRARERAEAEYLRVLAESGHSLAGFVHTPGVGWHSRPTTNKNLGPVKPPRKTGMGSYHPAFHHVHVKRPR